MYPPMPELSYIHYNDGWQNQPMESAPLDPSCLHFEATNSGTYGSLLDAIDVEHQLNSCSIYQQAQLTAQEPQDYTNTASYTSSNGPTYISHPNAPIYPPTAPDNMSTGSQTSANNINCPINSTNDILWDPSLLDFLPSLQLFYSVPTSSPLTLPNNQFGLQDGTLLATTAEQLLPSLEGFAEPTTTPTYAPLYHPIPRTFSDNSLASLSDELPRFPSIRVSPTTGEPSSPPHDPSDSSRNTPDINPSDELSYDDAVRQFKATKRQRRIAIKSKVTASSGASIQLVDGSNEFAPIFSQHDQLWYCNMCGKGIKRHGDVIRHWRSYNCPVRKAANRGIPKRLVCPFPSCKYSTGRRDGLSRHLNVHRPGGS